VVRFPYSNGMRTHRFSIGMALALTSMAWAQGKNDCPDTPANHWAYQAMADLKNVGIFAGVPDTLGHSIENLSRCHLAVAAHGSMTELSEVVMTLERSNEAVASFAGLAKDEPAATNEAESENRAHVRSLRHILVLIEKDLLDLTNAFGPELKVLGADPTEMAVQERRDCQKIATFRFAKLGEATKQFSDVPEGHWAAEPVKALRSVGILHGYGGEKFLVPKE